jgi:thiol-disulfide isomerase/thioredoxin
MPLLLLLTSACASGDTGVLEGQLAPRFEVLGVDGTTLGTEKLSGRPAVLIFWASWCGPCMSEVPDLQRLYGTYGDRVGFLAINMGEDPRRVHATVQDRGLNYPVALDLDESLASRFRVRSIPLVLVLDGSGRIRYRGSGLPRQPTVLLDGLLNGG